MGESIYLLTELDAKLSLTASLKHILVTCVKNHISEEDDYWIERSYFVNI